MFRTIFLMAAIALAAPTAAQDKDRSWEEIVETFERGCGDDQGVDRCDSKTQGRMHALYGIESPQDLLEEKTTTRRAMFVDGYGNDVIAITFLRRPGEAPSVEIASQIVDGFPKPQPLKAAVSEKVWRQVLSRSSHFNRMLASEIPQIGEDGKLVAPRNLCLHAWFTVVEAVDAPRPSPNEMMSSADEGDSDLVEMVAPEKPGTILVDAESACASGLATAYAFELAEIAHESLPECSVLDPDGFRDLPELLRSCSQLRGDRLAAGEAMDLVRMLNNGGSRGDGGSLKYAFAGFGERVLEKFKADIEGSYPHFFAPNATSPHDVTVEGRLVYVDAETDRPKEIADITLMLQREFDEFKIAAWTIENRRPYPEPVRR